LSSAIHTSTSINLVDKRPFNATPKVIHKYFPVAVDYETISHGALSFRKAPSGVFVLPDARSIQMNSNQALSNNVVDGKL
jgi:hypothetical protein